MSNERDRLILLASGMVPSEQEERGLRLLREWGVNPDALGGESIRLCEEAAIKAIAASIRERGQTIEQWDRAARAGGAVVTLDMLRRLRDALREIPTPGIH